MALRWYTVVIDCRDIAAQARWWAEVLGWRMADEAEDEITLVPPYATEELVRATPWEQLPPGLVFVPVPEGKTVKNRLHLDLAPHTSDDRDAEIGRLLDLGAVRVDVGQSDAETWTVLPTPKATSSACCPPGTAEGDQDPSQLRPASPTPRCRASASA